MTAHPLEVYGITPPPPGRTRTLCPKCSHTRIKIHEKCLRVVEVAYGWEVNCKHCNYREWISE